jgi:hypothetical protein
VVEWAHSQLAAASVSCCQYTMVSLPFAYIIAIPFLLGSNGITSSLRPSSLALGVLSGLNFDWISFFVDPS